ncbi:MAG TPA: CHAP domain-containing protein, partial [Candidatus Saccharimonadales bacterium]|nr:CHAP domain-containing protein [Candidatus Saccharimonadales bacterium]
MKSKVQTKRTAFTRFRALVVILSLALMGTIGVTTPAYASAPVLLSGSQWLGGNGANVCAPSTDMTCGGQAHVGGWSANWWQCVELAQRLYQMRGWHNGIFSGVNYAYQIYDRASILGMSSQANGSIGSIVPGDMIVHGSNEPYSGGAGHVSIVNSVVGSTINVIEQNTYNNDPTGQYSFSGSTLTRSGSGTIRGVVHDGDNHSIATPVTPDPTPPVELKSALSTARNADGRIELAAIGTDGNIYAKAQSVPNGSFNAG